MYFYYCLCGLKRSMVGIVQVLLHMCISHHAHDLHLVCHLLQHAPNLLVAFHKSELCILQPPLFREFLHEHAGCAQVVSRQAREEVVRHLQV